MRLFLPLIVLLMLLACTSEDDPTVDKSSKSDRRKMNISCFVYRDVNRNGVYDMADRPYSGLNVALIDKAGKEVRKQSNLAGFANFAMSAGNERHPISQPEVFRIKALTHPGWEITSGNADQTLEIIAMEDSPGGLVATATLGQVGVAPKPRVIGYLPDSPREADIEWFLGNTNHPDGELIPIRADDDGRFDMEIGTGNWEIAKQENGDLSVQGQFLLDSETTYIPDIGRRYSVYRTEHFRLDFDELTSSDTLYEVPSGYGGLDWHNWIATHHKFYNGFGYINATTSGEYSAYNSSGHPAEFSSSKPFHVRSVNIGVAWRQAESADIHIRAWRGDELLYHDRLRASVKGAMNLLVNYMNVTLVEISTETYWQVVIDDLTIARP